MYTMSFYGNLSEKFSGGNEWFYFIFNLGLGLIGIYLARHGMNKGWYLPLVRFITFIPFYEAGILYRKKLESKDITKGIIYFGIIGFSCLAIIYKYGSVPTYVFSWCRDFGKSNILMPYIVGFLGIAFWLRISRILLPSIGHSRLVNLIADNTWSIMLHQFAGFMLVKTTFYLIHLYTPYCHTFNIMKYTSNIWYYYLPNGRHQMFILYLIAGIIVPLGIHWFVAKLQNQLCRYKWLKWVSML